MNIKHEEYPLIVSGRISDEIKTLGGGRKVATRVSLINKCVIIIFDSGIKMLTLIIVLIIII